MEKNIKIIFITFIILLKFNIVKGKNEPNINNNKQEDIKKYIDKNKVKIMAYPVPIANPNYPTDDFCYWDETNQLYRIRNGYYNNNNNWNWWQILFWIFIFAIFFSIMLCFPCWDYEGYYYGYRPYTWGWKSPISSTKYVRNRCNQNMQNMNNNNEECNSIYSSLSSYKMNKHKKYNCYI